MSILDDDYDELPRLVYPQVRRATPFVPDPHVRIDENLALPKSCVQHLAQAQGVMITNKIGQGAFGMVFNACRTNAHNQCSMVAKVLLLLDDQLVVQEPYFYPTMTSEQQQQQQQQPSDYQEQFYNASRLNRRTSVAKFENECRIAELMGNEGVGPRVVAYFVCHNVEFKGNPTLKVGIIVSDKMGASLYDSLRSLSSRESKTALIHYVMDKLRPKIRIMFERGVTNRDIHANNIMITDVDDGDGSLGYNWKTNMQRGTIDVRIIDWGEAEYDKSTARDTSDAYILYKTQDVLQNLEYSLKGV